MTKTVKVEGTEVVIAALGKLQDKAAAKVVKAVARAVHMRAKKYPKAKHVTRASAYPETGDGFFTGRQRRWFWARFGEVIAKAAGRRVKFYTRTNRANRSWRVEQLEPRAATVFNDAPYAQFLHSPEQAKTGRARLSEKVGWKNTDEIVAEGAREFEDIANKVTSIEASKV